MNKTQIVFSYAGDLWTVNRQGGVATRLTSGEGIETEAGVLARWRYHRLLPASTTATSTSSPCPRPAACRSASPTIPPRTAWRLDARRKARPLPLRIALSYSRYTQLFTVSPEGGLPESLPLPMATFGGRTRPTASAWSTRRSMAASFRAAATTSSPGGGTAAATRQLSVDRQLRRPEHPEDSRAPTPTTFNPMWIGDKVYFLSDRNGPMTLFRYDPQSKAVTELIKNTGKDIVSASAGPGGIVYEQFGADPHLRPRERKEQPGPHRDRADLTEVRPRFQNVSREIRERAHLAHRRARGVRSARRDPHRAGREGRHPQPHQYARRRWTASPVWSPDGKSIAYFSDESGEYALHVKSQNGEGETHKIPLGRQVSVLLQSALVARQQAASRSTITS